MIDPTTTAACHCGRPATDTEYAPNMGDYCDDCSSARCDIISAVDCPHYRPATGFAGGYWREDHKCDADVTLRDDDHQLAVCRKPATHTDAHHDDELGVTWTDEHHA